MRKGVIHVALLLLLFAVLFYTGCGNEQAGKIDEEIPPKIDTTMSATVTVTEDGEAAPEEALFGADFYKGGYADVKGYAYVEEVDEAWCEEDCKKYDYVFFRITDFIESGSLKKIIQEEQGNAYFSEDGVGLGCQEDGVISYYNETGMGDMKKYVLPEELSKKILLSTSENPVSLRLIKKELSGGSGAPTCYSHFTEIEEL
jgi:hypothetical protein